MRTTGPRWGVNATPARLHGLDGPNVTQTVGGATGPKARVFFLFMVEEAFQRTDVWESFFAGVDPATFRVLLHCKQQNFCDILLEDKNPIGISQVETVPSFYCRDLVTPMVQLLRAATSESTSPSDKFVFLSESTLPVKPFPLVYRALSANHDSDICLSPTKEWIEMSWGTHGTRRAYLVKHSQWAVLNQQHAKD